MNTRDFLLFSIVIMLGVLVILSTIAISKLDKIFYYMPIKSGNLLVVEKLNQINNSLKYYRDTNK